MSDEKYESPVNATDAFEEQLRLLRRAKRVHQSKTDWGNPVERLEYLRESLRTLRRWWLDKLVPKRICPCCTQGPKISTRAWVFMPLANILHVPGPNAKRVRECSLYGECCMCRSCAMLYFNRQWGKGASRSRLHDKFVDVVAMGRPV